MSLEPFMTVAAFAYAAANIGLLCSIKFDLGKGSQKMADMERRLKILEGKIA